MRLLIGFALGGSLFLSSVGCGPKTPTAEEVKKTPTVAPPSQEPGGTATATAGVKVK